MIKSVAKWVWCHEYSSLRNDSSKQIKSWRLSEFETRWATVDPALMRELSCYSVKQPQSSEQSSPSSSACSECSLTASPSSPWVSPSWDLIPPHCVSYLWQYQISYSQHSIFLSWLTGVKKTWFYWIIDHHWFFKGFSTGDVSSCVWIIIFVITSPSFSSSTLECLSTSWCW